ncbi:endolytic transglycosylase MltG [Methyloparacoccus murrellii]
MAARGGGTGRRARLMRGVAGLFALLLLGLWIHADYRSSLDRPLPIRQSERLMVHKGQGLAAVAQELRQRRIVVEPVWLRLLAATRGVSGDLKFGEYEIPPGTTARGLLDMLVSGRSRQEPVTIIEGWTFRQMREALARHPNLRQETAGRTAEDIMALLGSPGLLPEGQFFPDTYFTGRHTSDLDILRQAHRKMRAILAAEWQDRAPNLPLNSPEEALTLASIVEKETGQASERPAIAGVFVRRLLQGMRLQTDPTVIYGMGEQFQGNIRREDLRRDTPYNTYTRSGLPPTPIALPGRQSIRAALHPAAGGSLYFVARGDGSHVFSATLEEHERAVDQFQRRR